MKGQREVREGVARSGRLRARAVGIILMVAVSMALSTAVPSAAIGGAHAATSGVKAGGAQTDADVAIVGGTMHTAAGPVIEGGTVLIRDGRIAAVARDVEVPSGVRVIDASGKVVTPGLVESYTQLGLVEIGAAAPTNDTASASDRITAAFNPTWALNPHSTLLAITWAGGVTRAVVAPGGGPAMIVGQGAVIDLAAGGATAMVVASPVAVFANLDEGAIEQSGGGSRGVAFLLLREAMEDARAYAEDPDSYRRGALRELTLSRLDLEAMVPVVRGEVPLAVRVNRAADITATLRLADELGLRLILLGAAEGWRVASEIAAADVPVVVNPLDNLPAFDALATTLENAARLRRAGVEVALSTFSSHGARNLRFVTGNAIANGMDWEDALRSVTAVPAAIWGVADRVGTLETGKAADVVVWDGDPFELMTGAEHVFIGGREMSLENRQTELTERYRSLEGMRGGSRR